MLSSFYAHKYYLSVTEVVYNQEAEAIQIISRIFYDDLEAVLQERYDERLVVEAAADQEVLDNYISKYLAKKLKISVDGEPQELNYIGKEYDDDYVVCYVEVSNIDDVEVFEIENTLLMDLYVEQKNMVHTEILGKKKSLLLRDGNTKAVLNFSE